MSSLVLKKRIINFSTKSKPEGFLPPSKVRKKNLGRRKLISIKRVLRLPEFTVDKSFTKYIRETRGVIAYPQRYNFFKIFYFLKRLQSYLRRYFLNVREKQFVRIHHACFSKARYKLWSLPHTLINFFDKAINQTLIRAKFFINLYELRTLLSNNEQFLLLNNNFIYKTKLFLLKEWDLLSYPININLNFIWRRADAILLLSIYRYTILYLYPIALHLLEVYHSLLEFSLSRIKCPLLPY